MDDARRQKVSYTNGWGILSQMRRFLHSTKGNYPGHTKTTLHPPIIDELLDKAFAAPNYDESINLVRQLQKVLFDELDLFMPLYKVTPLTAESPKVMKSGFWENLRRANSSNDRHVVE